MKRQGWKGWFLEEGRTGNGDECQVKTTTLVKILNQRSSPSRLRIQTKVEGV